jgi:hypothetical protein
MIYKAIDRKLNVEQHEPNKNGGELMCSVMVSSSCSNGGSKKAKSKEIFQENLQSKFNK